MNILIYSHSSSFGGGENALKNLVSLLLENHSVDIIFPNTEGHLLEHFLSMKLPCYHYPYTHAVPNLSDTLTNYSEEKIARAFETLGLDKKKFDCVISNTTVLLEGIFASKYLNIPHITYAHEYLDDPNLEPSCFSPKRYLSFITNESTKLLACSSFLKEILGAQDKTEVLYPFSFEDKVEHSLVDSDITDIIVIGTRSIRKNMHFAVTVQKALKLRGRNVRIHFIGNDNTGSDILHKTIKNHQGPVEFHNMTLDPYFIKGKKVINLITALTEPFGLTIVESMQRSIPVVASKSGGPQELLKEDFLYDVNDVDGCVRALERVIDDYENACIYSSNRYTQLQKKNSQSNQIKVVNKLLKNAVNTYKGNNFVDPILQQHNLFSIVSSPLINEKFVINNIAELTNNNVEELTKIVEQERKNGMPTVKQDIDKYDIVPFGYSKSYDEMYKTGVNLAIKLVPFITNKNKILMLSSILLYLLAFNETKEKLKILSIGDGLGVDSIKLTQCGFDVDYMDYDASLMTEIAKANAKGTNLKFVKEIKKKYDVVICLEVIEHVPDIFSFIETLNDAIKPNGLLFISECFDGIRDFWPSHLLANEKYASSLFLLLLPYFELVGFNRNPYGKPYIFSKRSGKILPKDIDVALSNRTAMIELFNSKIKLGI